VPDGHPTGAIRVDRPGDHPGDRAGELAAEVAVLRERISDKDTVIADLRQRLDAAERGPGTDPLTAIGIQTLSQAVELLREDVERERDRADRAERQGEDRGKRIDELQALLADERRRIDGLYTDLADARTAAVISGADAAALRTQLALLTERRPWWRRWFR
jgi:predicted RNase H-like nuclease (RuvC/YqgF family)